MSRGSSIPFWQSFNYWFPKLTGYWYNEKLGRLHFWLMTLGFFIITIPWYRVRLLGMLRRVADYGPALANSWRSRSLEWQIPSPPSEEDYPAPPVVGGPYDYGAPGSVYVRFGKSGKQKGKDSARLGLGLVIGVAPATTCFCIVHLFRNSRHPRCPQWIACCLEPAPLKLLVLDQGR